MSEVPKTTEPLEDRKPERVATPQRERGKKEINPPRKSPSYRFSGWGKKKK